MPEKNEVELLKERIDKLEKQLDAATQASAMAPSNRLAAGYATRQARREAEAERIADEIAKSKPVRCRIEKFVDGKGETRVNVAQNIVLSPSWRTRGIWPDAPNELRVREDDVVKDGKLIKGQPIVHTLPERVFKALQPEVVRVN